MDKSLAKLVKGLNNETKTLILEILDSPIKWELIGFYQANPFSIHTARGLANIIGRRTNQVLKEAEELAQANILKKISENGGPCTIYAYEPNRQGTSAIKALANIYSKERGLVAQFHELLKEGRKP